MSRIIPLVVAVLVSPSFVGQVFAQLTPPAGTAGAGLAPINGIPYGPANPRVTSDPSGIGNAGAVPPLRSNVPTAVTNSYQTAPIRPLTPPPSVGGSSRIVSERAVEPKSKAPSRRRSQPEVSHFTGICRGC
jgi:hypothetical protein